MRIRIAFYKQSKTLFGRLIRRQQRVLGIPERYARYSHVELVFMYDERERGAYDRIDDIHNAACLENFGLSFSSSELDGGCRFKAIEWDTTKWDFVDIPVTKEQYHDLLVFCKKENGNRYNKVGIFFAQILNFNRKKPGSWFCSEIVTRALQEIGMLCTRNALFTNPGELAMELEDKNYIISY